MNFDQFDQFIADCLADSVNATAAPASTWTAYDGPPCPECGCLVAMLDPTPYCLRCAMAVEGFALLHEKAFTALSAMWDMLPALPAARRGQAHDDAALLVEHAMRVWQATEVRA